MIRDYGTSGGVDRRERGHGGDDAVEMATFFQTGTNVDVDEEQPRSYHPDMSDDELIKLDSGLLLRCGAVCVVVGVLVAVVIVFFATKSHHQDNQNQDDFLRKNLTVGGRI